MDPVAYDGFYKAARFKGWLLADFIHAFYQREVYAGRVDRLLPHWLSRHAADEKLRPLL